ncbi:fungal-specific transcription factor domain-containing protein [Apiospora aurea]|uniref:Fungal-specific transcription factor domain-containing protein n=1 Tax=Apiospora aurea TaxID=335848 RepID=A0ABR1Q895_9PEZI
MCLKQYFHMPMLTGLDLQAASDAEEEKSNAIVSILAQAAQRPARNASSRALERSRGLSGASPVPKSYVQALERHVASLELFIQQLAKADSDKREHMLSGYTKKQESQMDTASPASPAADETDVVLARARAGQLKKTCSGSASSQYFGSTGLFHTYPGTIEPLPDAQLPTCHEIVTTSSPGEPTGLHFSPHDETCQSLMSTFFKEQYPYHMCVYREFFLRDYDTGAGRYYSEVLLFAMCAIGALATGDPSMSSVSEAFSNQAETMVYASLDKPDLTLLQALILLSYHAIGHGKASKGWLFLGIALRITHEMGLHLDPNNWSSDEPPEEKIDREILRRVYWAAFNSDKQISMYFGRPPALYPHESDVRNTIRIPYPDDWQGLLDTYIAKDISATAYEDGIALSGSFIYRVELYKIVHTMITDLFENRRHNADSAVLAATAQRIHVQLHKWLATLPSKLYWNQWSNGPVQPFVLHLHMVFHTAMIILHRPPRHLYGRPGMSESEDVEICYESLQAITRLLRSYSRYYKYPALPLDFVHTLSVAAGTVLMRKSLEDIAADDSSIVKSMETILDAMDAIKHTWPCIVEVKASVVQAMGISGADDQRSAQNPLLDFGFLAGFGSGNATGLDGLDLQISDADLGILLTDDFLMDPVYGPTLGTGGSA